MKVLKIGAVWCPGCLIMKPRWAEIEKENPWLETEYFDYDDDAEKLKKYDLGNVLPIFIFLDKEGNELMRIKGEVDKSKLLELIEKYKDN
ncbi:thioredoxin [Candidatus Parcubacteria bacterium]|nr:MAG: thioredoxin [Candidatus Parcubacteria bacterium]